jgi:hypothetical protein
MNESMLRGGYHEYLPEQSTAALSCVIGALG